ncbi:MAG: hypothetical protein ACXWWQ_00820 [Candidatus Limnocylindria bacterium]
MHDQDRDRSDSTDESGGYPTMPPLDTVDPDVEQEGEAPDAPESGWGGAARAAEGGLSEKERER